MGRCRRGQTLVPQLSWNLTSGCELDVPSLQNVRCNPISGLFAGTIRLYEFIRYNEVTTIEFGIMMMCGEDSTIWLQRGFSAKTAMLRGVFFPDLALQLRIPLCTYESIGTYLQICFSETCYDQIMSLRINVPMCLYVSSAIPTRETLKPVL